MRRATALISIPAATLIAACQTPDDLLPVATDLARDLKADELGSRTAALTVACVCAHLPGRTEVRDENFLEHPWNGTPSRDAEYLTWTRSDS
ncbi:hypothetical protein [Nocardia sp. NPDC060249]|uniref:hypothetical protein n=1 Tax=Nocardia sp. NPDC060249 TaxID=3347082 RepID=UPI00364C06FC